MDFSRFQSTELRIALTRGDEVEAEWRIITPIEEGWAQLPPPSFPNYAAGSSGPAEADTLMAGDHRRWRDLEPPPPKNL